MICLEKLAFDCCTGISLRLTRFLSLYLLVKLFQVLSKFVVQLELGDSRNI